MLAIGAQYLDVMHTHYRTQPSIVAVGIAQRLACIVNLLGIQQSLQNGLISLEDGAVLVQSRNGRLVADVLESHKILCEVGTEVFESITVIVNQPSIFYLLIYLAYNLRCRRPLHHLACKRLRSLAPRAVR